MAGENHDVRVQSNVQRTFDDPQWGTKPEEGFPAHL